MEKYLTFETKRLIIRPTNTEDAGFILELLNTPKWLKYIGDRNVKTKTAAKNYIKEKMLSQLERLGYANYTLITKKENQKIGTCGLFDRPGLEGIDIGFAFLPEYEGMGYGFEAAETLKNAAFEDFGITTINAITTKDNFASQKLLEKLEFKQSGTTILPDDDVELLLYKIEKDSD